MTFREMPMVKTTVEVTVSRNPVGRPVDSRMAFVVDVYRWSPETGEIVQAEISGLMSDETTGGTPGSRVGAVPDVDERQAGTSSIISNRPYLVDIEISKGSKKRKKPSREKSLKGFDQARNRSISRVLYDSTWLS